jgi:hypothetical protein
MKTSSSQKQSGSSLIVVMSILATLMVIVGIAAEYTTTIGRDVQRSTGLENAIAVGDSCVELLFANWRSICRTTPTSALGNSSFSSIALPTATQLNLQSLSSYATTRTDYYTSGTPNPPTISNFSVTATDAEWRPLAGAAATPEPIMGQVSQDVSTLVKTTPAVFNYVASADVTLPTLRGNVVAKVRRVFQKQQLSPWNFAIFYVDPLEIHPGPEFTVTGWVHTNSDLYTAHSNLHFADKVTYGSDWFVGYKPGDGYHTVPPAPASPTYLSNLPPARDQALQPFGLDSGQLMNPGGNANDDSYRELIEPPTNAADPLLNTRYWDQANVIIKISDTPSPNTILIGTPHFNGTNYDGNVDALPSSSSLYKMLTAPGVITTNQSIQDNREGAAGGIRLVTLDVSKIVNGAGANPNYGNTANGNSTPGGFSSPIIYIFDASNTSANRRGVRIKGGSRIPTGGLTVASNNTVYLQGDFNTGATGSTVPSNNSANHNADGTYVDQANPPAPQVNGYTRAPCSIIADAVNLLSNSWLDSNSGIVPTASPTTFNTAIIAGIVPTSPVGGDGAYSGGAENFPRFLEDWDKQTLSYYGSMVELYKSAQSIGEWGKTNVYIPPTRQWYFDTNFRTKPPPGSIMIYSYIKGKWSVL